MKLPRQFASLSLTDRRLIVEATALLMLAWICLRLRRFSVVQRFLDFAGFMLPRTDRQSSSRATAVDRIAWAITAIPHRLTAFDNCLVKALAGDAMLRRRGLASEIRFGVREHHNDGGPLEAHAWVESGSDIVIGALEKLPDYAVLSATKIR